MPCAARRVIVSLGTVRKRHDREMEMRCGSIALFAVTLAGCGGSEAKRAPPVEGGSAVSVTASPDSAETWRLSETGIGPVRVGMTVAEAAAALPDGAAHPETQECAYVGLSGLPVGVSLMTEGGRVVRVDVDDSSAVATARGARVGWTEAQVLAAYPGARVQPHKYEDGHYLVAIPGAPADTVHRIVFETARGVVTRFRGGVIPAVEYVEGCS
jgi:hypothetical protein